MKHHQSKCNDVFVCNIYYNDQNKINKGVLNLGYPREQRQERPDATPHKKAECEENTLQF